MGRVRFGVLALDRVGFVAASVVPWRGAVLKGPFGVMGSRTDPLKRTLFDVWVGRGLWPGLAWM
jgi:hypothetical protein